MLSMDTSFSEWLNQHMEARHISNAKLAKIANVDRSTITNVLNDKKNPGPDLCKALAQALHLPQREVFIAAGLMDDEQITDLSPKVQHIVELLNTVDDAVLDLVSAQIELVLIPHGQKVIGSKHAKAKQ